MFGYFSRNIRKLFPLFGLATLNIAYLSKDSHQSKASVKKHKTKHNNSLKHNNPKIKFVDDLSVYIEKQINSNKTIIFYQIKNDPFIDEQVFSLADQFIKQNCEALSQQYEFLFIKPSINEVDSQLSFIIFGPRGQKMINIDGYINKNKKKPHLQINTKKLKERLIQSIGYFKEVGLANLYQQLSKIDLSENYAALISVAHNITDIKQSKENLEKYLKNHSIKSKNINKLIIKDQQTSNILGIKSSDASNIYFLIPKTKNIRDEYLQKANFFSIQGKQYTLLDATADLSNIFIFPPIEENLKPEELVLNIYLNKNKGHTLEDIIYKQFSKPQYSRFHKSLIFSSNVEDAQITYEMNDYTKLALQAYEPNTKLKPEEIKQILNNSYEWNYSFTKQNVPSTENILSWIDRIKGQEKYSLQYFKSLNTPEIYATQIVGQQLKKHLSQKGNKIVYHYSEHCHGCKKFGWQFELFAKKKSSEYKDISFYRINNDNNKAKGMKNFDSTPVFAFYKDKLKSPFIYKMSIFTTALFEDFLKITNELKLISNDQFQQNIINHQKSAPLIRELIN